MLTLEEKIFTTNNANFEETVWQVFNFQAQNCPVYKQYIEYTGKNPASMGSLQDIPFLPIDFFKQADVIVQRQTPQKIFTSSATSGTGLSRHPVADINLYEQSFTDGFHYFYGLPAQYCFLALLPSYLERDGSSLVYMADALIKQSGHPQSGFYLYDYDTLAAIIIQNEAAGQRTFLLGVSFALLDFAERYQFSLKNTLIMETGGMKGRRKEITRPELHAQLTAAFGVNAIHSEYGMTELLSQAYSKGNGLFHCPPWMRVLVRSSDDPFGYVAAGKTGALNVIDLANLYSCSFIETADMGRLHADDSFEVLGRMDFSDVRGCNTMVG